MAARTAGDYAVLTLRVVVGLWFLVLGAEKILHVGIPTFARQVADFAILQDPWNLGVAYLVAWLEVVGGICLLSGWLLRGAARALVGLNLVFFLVNVQALYRGLEVDCGCFGSLFELGYAPKLVLIAVQIVLLGLVIATERAGGRRIFAGARMRLPEA